MKLRVQCFCDSHRVLFSFFKGSVGDAKIHIFVGVGLIALMCIAAASVKVAEAVVLLRLPLGGLVFFF